MQHLLHTHCKYRLDIASHMQNGEDLWCTPVVAVEHFVRTSNACSGFLPQNTSCSAVVRTAIWMGGYLVNKLPQVLPDTRSILFRNLFKIETNLVQVSGSIPGQMVAIHREAAFFSQLSKKASTSS
jgi:hypothetical protein